MQTVLVQNWAGQCTITGSFWPLENRILHQKFSTIYQSKAYSKLIKRSQRSCKNAQDKIKQIGSKVSSSACKFQKKQGKFKNSPRTVENEFAGKLYIKLKLESSSFTSKNSFQKCSIDCSQFWKQWVSQNSVFRAISSKMYTMSSKLSSKILAI